MHVILGIIIKIPQDAHAGTVADNERKQLPACCNIFILLVSCLQCCYTLLGLGLGLGCCQRN